MQATSELLIEVGYEGMSIDGVAARAGVGKQTVYRWWPSKSALVTEAMLEGHLSVAPQHLPDTGELAVDLSSWLAQQAAALADPYVMSVVRATAAAAADNDEAGGRLYERITGPAHHALVARLRSGRSVGQVRPEADLDAAADALTGVQLYLALTRQNQISQSRLDGLLDLTMRGIGPVGPG